MSKARRWWLTLSLWLCVQGLSVPPSSTADSPAGSSYEAWRQRREAVLSHPAILRYYTFQDAQETTALVPNLAGRDGALSFGVVKKADAPDERLQVIEGRWPEKKAVRLDRGYFSAEPFDVTNKSFTVEAWLRTNGPGSIRGEPVTYGGTLLSVGIGFWDGWRLTILYPDRVFGFEIGRPKPASSFGIRTGATPDGVWHHVAVT